MTKKLYIMSGPPGSGKSTWLKKRVPADKIVSRDLIRFDFLRPGDDYFKYEDQVKRLFVANIQEKLNQYDEVYADATHLTPKSRAELLRSLNLTDVEVNAIAFEVPLRVCLERNDLRSGRSVVPRDVVRRMYASYTHPTPAEGFTHIYYANVEGDLRV